MTARIIPFPKKKEQQDGEGLRHISVFVDKIIRKIEERHAAAGVPWPHKHDKEQNSE